MHSWNSFCSIVLNCCIFSFIGHIIYNQGPINDHRTAKLTVHNLPSVSHPPLTENYNGVLLLNSRSKTIQSPPPNKVPSTQLFPDVSPTSYLMTEQLSITQHFDTVQHLSSALNQDIMSQLSGTTQDVSSATVTGQLTLSGQTELEPSLSTSMLEPSLMTFTPALPSELGFFSGQLESLKASSSTMPPLQTFSKSLLPDIGVSSSQKNLESPVVSDLQSKPGTQLQFDQNARMQTLSSDILLTSLQLTYPPWALQMSRLSTKTHHITSVPLSMFKDQPFKEQPSAKSAHESMQFMPSMQQTLHTLLPGETQQIKKFSRISLVTRMTASLYFNTTVLTTTVPSPSVTYPVPTSMYESTGLVPEDHFDLTAPSTVQQPYTTSFIHQIQNTDPSFPLCGQSVAQDHVYVNRCTPEIKSTYLESTVDHVLDFMTSYSQDEKHWTAFQSQFLIFDSATPQLGISDVLPTLDGSGFSVITYTSLAPSTSALSVSIENSLFICQTDSSGPVTKGRPTQQILSTSLSQFYGMSTTLLTSLQAVGLSSYRRQSSVQPTPPLAPISSKYHEG